MWNIWKPQCQVHNQKNASCPGISAEQIDWHVQKQRRQSSQSKER